MHVVPRRTAPRCVFCRLDDGALRRCRCGARFHLECLAQLGASRCATLGCDDRAGRPPRRPARTERRGLTLTRLLQVAAVGVAALLAASHGLFQPLAFVGVMLAALALASGLPTDLGGDISEGSSGF